MAAVEVTISGVLYDKHARTIQQVVLIGEASLTGVGVGGGPIIPPPSGGGGDKPPIIWGGGNVPMPTPPIANLPGTPNWPNFPDQPPQQPPSNPDIVKPPPPEGGWAWSPEYGWGYFPGTGGAGPKGKSQQGKQEQK